MKKITPLLLLVISLFIFSCSKDNDDEILISNQELIIGNWQLLEIVSVNAMGNSSIQDFTTTVLHQLAFNADGKLITTIQPLNEDHTPNGEAQIIESNYTLSQDGKHITISNNSSMSGDILRLGKTDLIYKINLAVTSTAEYRLKRFE